MTSPQTPFPKPPILLTPTLTASRGILIGLIGTVFLMRSCYAQEPAASAEDFVDRIGVCTHWGYSDTPYGTVYSRVKQLLADAGIRHIRDSFHPREIELFDDLGIRTTLITSPPDVPKIVEMLRPNISLIDMVEGPNEVDIFPQSAQYQGRGYPEGPRQFQKDLYGAIQSAPDLAHLPVIAPSVGHPGANRILRPIEGFDYLVMHSYAGGQMPSLSLESAINNNREAAYDLIPPGQALKPLVVTESGYHTALGGEGGVLAGVQPGVSEQAQAKYLLRHFAVYFAAGIVRTFTYEFLDEFPDYTVSEREGTNAEACFGIIRHDLTPKPAYTAVKNLIALLSESTWNPKQKRWIPRATEKGANKTGALPHPGSLAFTLSGQQATDSAKDMANVRHVLLQKRNGDFYLLLWQEVSSFDTATRKDIVNSDVGVTLTLKPPFQNWEVRGIYDPRHGTTDVMQQGSSASPNGEKIQIPDSVLVVRISPKKAKAGLPRKAILPFTTRIAAVTAKTTGSTVDLMWKPEKGPKPAGYFVYRLGQYVGRTTLPRFHDSSLRPDVGYPYTVRAYSSDGRVGSPVPFIARTKRESPDLVIREVYTEPAQPKPGDTVTFCATIMNQGNASTPGGVVIGVAFSLDGKVVSWSDRFSGPLAPGKSITLRSNNGPQGTGTWTAEAMNAPHRLEAFVDDVNRIREGNESNNVRVLTIGETAVP